MLSRTKIVATVGPASSSDEVLRAMIDGGADVFRLNLSHGHPDEHLALIPRIRRQADDAGAIVAILADLPGPKVRAGDFGPDAVLLMPGAGVALTAGEDQPSTASRITVGYPTLLQDLSPDDRVVIGDGAISLMVAAVDDEQTWCTVRTGGVVRGRPGVHLPAERLRLGTPTAEDLDLAALMVEAGVDFLAVSFVRRADDLRRVRQAIAPSGCRLVAKIETMAAIDDLPAIIDEADALMVARGDLGIDCPLEDVPHLQKRIIRSCVESGVPVITATQMMESMISSPSPTRAEVSDIANAVFDGTDALMLSGETAVGSDPALVVRTMTTVAARAEQEASYRGWAERLGRIQRGDWPDDARRITMAITRAGALAADDAGVAAILCCTRSGRTVQAMARFRPVARLIGLSPDPDTLRSLALSWGVTPVAVGEYATTDEMVWFAVENTLRAGHIRTGDTVMILAGAPDVPSMAATDVLRFVTVR